VPIATKALLPSKASDDQSEGGSKFQFIANNELVCDHRSELHCRHCRKQPGILLIGLLRCRYVNKGGRASLFFSWCGCWNFVIAVPRAFRMLRDWIDKSGRACKKGKPPSQPMRNSRPVCTFVMRPRRSSTPSGRMGTACQPPANKEIPNFKAHHDVLLIPSLFSVILQ
jgi:hypothetical protein